MDCSPPGSSVHGIFQARVLEWGAIAFSTCNFSFMRGHCSVQIGSSFFQVIWIIVLFVKWAVAPRENVECISELAISYIFLLKAYILLFLSNYEVSCMLALYRLVNIFTISYYNIYLLHINIYIYISIYYTLYNIFTNSLKSL